MTVAKQPKEILKVYNDVNSQESIKHYSLVPR